MSDLKIYCIPEPILYQIAEPVKVDFSAPAGVLRVKLEPYVKLAFAMHAIIAPSKIPQIGYGLAAPQVGKSIRLVVINVPGYVRLSLINPVIESMHGEDVKEEGCLSIPGVRIRVPRATKIRLSYIGLNGVSQTVNIKSLLARVVQHEVDHLNGKLISYHAHGMESTRIDSSKPNVSNFKL